MQGQTKTNVLHAFKTKISCTPVSLLSARMSPMLPTTGTDSKLPAPHMDNTKHLLQPPIPQAAAHLAPCSLTASMSPMLPVSKQLHTCLRVFCKHGLQAPDTTTRGTPATDLPTALPQLQTGRRKQTFWCHP
eukprot:scaffold9055_cov21-Tisochrysis_lutea.AAC.2